MEYALILVLVAIVVIVVLALLGPAIGEVFSEVLAGLDFNPPVYARSNVQGNPAIGEWHATQNFCNLAGSGHTYNAWNVGSGWNVTAGTDVPQSSINGGVASLTTSSTCP